MSVFNCCIFNNLTVKKIGSPAQVVQRTGFDRSVLSIRSMNETILAAILKNIIHGFPETLYPMILTLHFKGKSRLKNNLACMFVWLNTMGQGGHVGGVLVINTIELNCKTVRIFAYSRLALSRNEK